MNHHWLTVHKQLYVSKRGPKSKVTSLEELRRKKRESYHKCNKVWRVSESKPGKRKNKTKQPTSSAYVSESDEVEAEVR